MTSKKLTELIDAGQSTLQVHQHRHEPRPLAVCDDDAAARYLGLPGHKRHTYKALGVAMADLPGGRFAVLVADVEAALRARGVADTSRPTPAAADDDLAAIVGRSGLRMVSR
jgi:hypothetical protein